MFPFCFEWVWDMSHIVFMGGLWFALFVLIAGMKYSIIKALIDTSKGKGEAHH